MADAGSINGLSKQFFERLKNQRPNDSNGNAAKANPLQVDADVFSANQNAQATQVNIYSQSGVVKQGASQTTSALKSKDNFETNNDKDGEEVNDLTTAIKQNNQLAAAQGSGLNLDKVLSLLAD